MLSRSSKTTNNETYKTRPKLLFILIWVQFRTISMDWWASLEHKIRYKKGLPSMEYIEKELFECAKVSAELDHRMERLQTLSTHIRNNSSVAESEK